jgi:hypothetical protein
VAAKESCNAATQTERVGFLFWCCVQYHGNWYILKMWKSVVVHFQSSFLKERFYTGNIFRCSSRNNFENTPVSFVISILLPTSNCPNYRTGLDETWYDRPIPNFIERFWFLFNLVYFKCHFT